MILQDDFIGRVVRTQLKLGQEVSKGEGLINIVYVEGVDLDGELNDDLMNEWNDLRIVYQVISGKPQILGKWIATTEPGRKYTQQPLNPGGAFRIAFGQYKAWSVGWHKDHRALIQVGEIKGHRDRNKDGFRTGDSIVSGSNFGVNQHWGWDLVKVEGASAGCLVGRTKQGHKEFMKLVEGDNRYQADKGYIFYTAILDGSKLEK